MSSKIAVNAFALGQIMGALNGPSHLIRELQVTRGLPGADLVNPIDRINQDVNDFLSGKVDDSEKVSVIDVEKLMCKALGIEWDSDPSQISIASLIQRLKGYQPAAPESWWDVRMSRLTAEEKNFVELVRYYPSVKLNDGRANSSSGNPLWKMPEALGLIEPVGSYKWKVLP